MSENTFLPCKSRFKRTPSAYKCPYKQSRLIYLLCFICKQCHIQGTYEEIVDT